MPLKDIVRSPRLPGIQTLALSLAIAIASTAAAAAAPPTFHRVTFDRAQPRMQILDRFDHKGQRVTIYTNGFVSVESRKTHSQLLRYAGGLIAASRAPVAPNRAAVLAALSKPVVTSPYLAGRVVAVVAPGTSFASSDVHPPASALAQMHAAIARTPFSYSNDMRLNRVLTAFGVSEAHKLFTGERAARLASMRSRVATALPIENTYTFTVTNGTVRGAVAALRALPSVLYASPDFRVSPMNVPQVSIPARVTRPMNTTVNSIVGGSGIPTNFDVLYSGQSMLNAPGVDAIAAYDEIGSKFHQLPGAGEIITNVSIADLDDPSALTNRRDPCFEFLSNTGYPTTTEVIGNQRYLNLPSMPLIPAYTTDGQGNINPLGEVCGADPLNGEIDLDFSVMAPLPHDRQRPGALGSAFSDLLGIAPGAQYRLVAPENANAAATDIAGAFLGASLQQPAPNVITASIGFGVDANGFPSRYLEEDPWARSVIASIVADGIVVCIASGDGLRTYTNAAVNPSGGTVPIDVVPSGSTDLNDDEFSTIPSAVADTGSITVGGTTLDDVTAAPPDEARFAKYRDQLAFPEVRWDGFGNFASAFGPRVNISAPSDNIIVTDMNGTATLNGGTSAATPEVAAAAAVAMQVARLTGKPFSSATALRSFLVAHANPIPNVPQADQSIAVGPQVDVTRTVEALLRQAGSAVAPIAHRVAIVQRYPLGASDFAFTTDTDPSAIDLMGLRDTSNNEIGYTFYQPITIAPDWEGIPLNAKYRLFVSGKPGKLLGINRYARLYPSTLLAAAGLPLYSTQSRTINLTYQATVGLHTAAEASFALSFLPNTREIHGMGPAPVVEPVTTGGAISVAYNIENVDIAYDQNPTLTVSYPGRTSPLQPGYKPLYQIRLTQPTGTLRIPISALQGDGVYGIGVAFTRPGFASPTDSTTWAYTRVANAGSTRPSAPLLSSPNAPSVAPGHYLDVPYGGSFRVAWDVSNVKGATGAILEIAAPGPTEYGSYNTFNNPNGSIKDDNGVDSGSQYVVAVSGATGTTIIQQSKIAASEYQTVRVIPTNGTAAAGEASAESTVATHGIVSADGGNIAGGFTVNAAGTDGLLTSNQLVANAAINGFMLVSSVQAFSQKTNTVGSFVASNAITMPYDGGLGAFIDYFNVYGYDVDPVADSTFFNVSPGYETQCSPACLDSGELALGSAQVDWIGSLNQFATGAAQVDSGGITPLPMPTAPTNGNHFTSSSSDYLLGTPQNGLVSNPSLTQTIRPTAPRTVPSFGSTYIFANLSQLDASGGDDEVLGMSVVPPAASDGYAVALATNPWACCTNMLDVIDTSTGTERAIALDANFDKAAFPRALVADGLTQQAYFLSENATLGSTQLSSYPLAGSGSGAPERTLDGIGPLAMANLTNGWLAIGESIAPDWQTNANVLAAVEIVNPSTGADYLMETSSFSELGNFILQDLYGLPLFNNFIQANPTTKTIYLLGPTGTEIQPIPISGLGIDLRGAHR